MPNRKRRYTCNSLFFKSCIMTYLKISNLTTDLDSKKSDWYTKVEPLYSDFVAASQSYFKSVKNVFVNQHLILFKGWFQHFMQISTKAVGVRFKNYYFYNFLFLSQVRKISKLKKKPGLTDPLKIIYRLCKSLSTT